MVTEAVLDSSTIVALTTTETHSEWAIKNTGNYEYYHILDLSFYEVANALKYKTSKEFDAKDAISAYKQAEKIMKLSAIHSFNEVVTEALNKALELKISVYDAAFLALSDKHKMKLLTLDLKLTKKLENTKYDELISHP